jgi:hypothetical protein
METIMSDEIWYFLIVDGVVVQKQPYWEEGFIEGPSDVVPGYLYSNGEFISPPPTPIDWVAVNTEKLNAFLRQANAQITAIQGRIDMINDAIEIGEDEPGWAEELPSRAVQITAWKKYRINLNKVVLQAGWASAVVWPITPNPYTNEMSSAVISASLS